VTSCGSARRAMEPATFAHRGRCRPARRGGPNVRIRWQGGKASNPRLPGLDAERSPG
jgi:hypothetical protein